MDRRYICPGCAVKWLISADHPQTADLTHCAACGEKLVPFVGSPPESVLRAARSARAADARPREASR